MNVSLRAGQPADRSRLVNVLNLVTASYTEMPDLSAPEQRVAFGTSGHRDSAFGRAFNEWHILTISEVTFACTASSQGFRLSHHCRKIYEHTHTCHPPDLQSSTHGH